MSMDVSRLAIEVTTTGIKEASTALGGLSRSAGTADGRVKSLTDNLAALMRTGGGVSGAIAGLTGTMSLINSALQSASANATAMAQALAQSAQGMNSLTNATNQASGALREKNKWGGVVQTTLKAMATAALAYVGVNFVKHSIQAADSWTMMEAKLKLATGSFHNAKFAQQELFAMAQKLRVPLEDMTKLFARLAPTMRNNKKSFEETAGMVEGVSLALQLNGATAGESASVMLQFSQAMQKGRLDGAEFNAIAENGSLILRALEKQTGKSAGELKKMGSEGKLSFNLIQTAIQSHLAQWRADFATLPVTVDGAVQRIKNAWMKAMGELSTDTGMNAGLVKTLSVFESLIPVIRDELIGAFIAVGGWIDRNRESLGAVWDQSKALLGDIWNIVGALFNMGAGIEEATGGINVFGLLLFTARATLGAIVDIVKVIASSFVLAGADVVDFFLTPLYGVTKIIEQIAKGLGWTLDMLAKGAEAVGMEDTAKMLRGAAEGANNFAAGANNIAFEMSQVTAGAREMAASWTEGLRNGKGELDKVLAGEVELNLATQKRLKLDKDAWGKTTGKPSPTEDPKAIKAHEHAMKAANAELQQSIVLYQELAKQYELIEKYGLNHDKLSKAEKEEIDLKEKLRLTTDALAKKTIEQALAVNQATQEIERMNKLRLDTLKMDEDEAKSQGAKIQAAEAEARALQDKINNFGKAKGAVEELALAQAQATLQAMIEGGETEASIERQRRLVDSLQLVADKTRELGGLEAGKKLDELLDPRKAINFGNELGNAFGKAGKAMEKVVKGLEQYDKRQSKIEQIRKAAENVKLTDSKKYAEAMEEAANLETRSRLEGYADMAGAAKTFFKEGSTGYKTLEAAERAFRLFEMGMAMQSFIQKSGLLNMFTAASATAQAAQTASTVSGASVEIGAKMAVANANAVAGVANQANGDPYSAFPRMAAMAAIMVGLGLAVSGGGGKGPKAAPELTDAQKLGKGIGTVLGDDAAKSESIMNALEMMRDNSNIGLTYTSEMLASLRNIDLKMGGMTAAMARIPGITTGKNFNANIGTSSSGIQGFFGKTTTREIQDTGLLLNGTANNLAIQQYLDILETKTKSGFLGIGGGTKTSTYRQNQGVDGGMAAGIGSIFADISDTIVAAGTSLGLSANEMKQRLNEFVLSAEISLKGLNGEELEKALQSFFSASADQLAMYAAGSFSLFQKAGEGYFETLTRVATETERAKDAMSKLGVSMVGLWELQNKTGDVDVELVRESLMRKEAGTTLANIMRLLDGSMEDLIANYRDLTRIRNAMVSMGLGINTLSLDLIRGAGGIKELSSAFDSYVENFYTNEEQTAMKMSQLSMEFSRLGIAVPQSRAAFKALVTQLMAAGPMGQELAGRVLALSDTFSEAMEMYDETTGQRITDARDALSEAYDRESSALENTRDKMQQFADSLKEFKDTLIMGDMSPLSTMEKYQTALAKYEDVSTRAMAGDEDAISEFQSVAQELLALSREVNASGTDYMADFNRVLAATQLLEQYTQGQADQATTQLEAMKQQVEALISIEESTKTVAEAIVELLAIMNGEASTLTGQITAQAVDSGSVGSVAPAPLTTAPTAVQTASAAQAATAQTTNVITLSELQALRAEVKALREEAKLNANQVANATYDANDKAADKVVDGLKVDPATSTSWQQPVAIA